VAHGYVTVGWNRQKRLYDAALLSIVASYLAVFAVAEHAVHRDVTIETSLIRAFGTCAFLMLHVILSIGPLARLDPRFLPLLYNRRHFGVTMFLVAAVHGVFSLVQFHALSDMNPFVSVLVSDAGRDGLAAFPFQPLGAAALLILFLMAATSHDFWLANLTAPVWKSLHMLVYAAYALLVAHVALGALQAETSPVLVAVAAVGLAWVVGVHVAAALKGRRADRELRSLTEDGWIDAGRLDAIPEGRAIAATIGGESVAIYRYDGKVSAISGVCRHQNGPLAEGRIVDGCVTCPWHGYQYLPDTGASPAPFTESVPTFDVRLVAGRVLVHPRPHPAGTRVEPAACAPSPSETGGPFYVGYLPQAPAPVARFVRRVVVLIAVVALGLAVVLVVAQAPFAAARFEYGTHRMFHGTVREHPYPFLQTEAEDGGAPRIVPLVAPGKHGAAALTAGFDGRAVSLEGTLIEREGRTMVEVVPGSVRERAGGAPPVLMLEELGETTLSGEIVDSKCFLGVMNPGRLKVHRACAVRCISGGAPPLLYVRDLAGREAYVFLVGADGRPVNRDVLPLVAQPVEVSGMLRALGDRLFLYADPRAIRRTG
jgi:nitrite reductase/ring-hydroxylating ferredoxin subunit/DMSO/TMAO reductase YedYZ heme-binding membrane subunit